MQQTPALLVARPTCFEPFVEDRTQAGVQCHDHRRGRGVVVLAARARDGVVRDHPQVEVPALAALDEPLPRPLVDGERRKPGRHPQALLRAAVRDVDVPLVDVHRNAAERRHAVDQYERVALRRAQRLDVVAHASRRLGVHDGDDLRRWMSVEQTLRIDGRPPFGVDTHHVGAAPRRDIAHALTEDAVHPDDDDIARPDDVHERRFHTRGAGAADRKRQRVVGAKDRAQPVARLVEHIEEIRVEVAQQRTRERLDHFRIGVARARTHEHAVAMWHRAVSLCWGDAPRCCRRRRARARELRIGQRAEAFGPVELASRHHDHRHDAEHHLDHNHGGDRAAFAGSVAQRGGHDVRQRVASGQSVAGRDDRGARRRRRCVQRR